ncbi:MAG TPA: hypothetical protein VHC41_03775 [Mycobacteriales bacterium]|jgi:hypothetical protein|nr:hypothetical protein [Mycobacteriales bacterium]
MAQTWTASTARDVKAGERIRTQAGEELTVTRIESPFMGMDGMVAFIEDSAERWYKRPLPLDAALEVLRD